MRKRISLLLATVACIGILVACSTSANKSYTYSVETGDNIKVEVDLKGGYDITKEIPCDITKDGERIFSCMFAYGEYYDVYRDGAEEAETATILDEGETKDGNQYFFYRVSDEDGTEHDFIMKVKDSETVFILASLDIDEDVAVEAFNSITVTKED